MDRKKQMERESVGGQSSAGFKANLTAIAGNAGYQTTGKTIETGQDLGFAVKTLLAADGPAFVEVRIRKGSRPDLPPLKVSHIDLRKMFMRSIVERY